MLYLMGARLLDPWTGMDEVGDLLIDDGKYLAVGGNLSAMAEGAQRIDARGLCAAPGLMDAHVHFRDPGFTWKEDLLTGAGAAKRGGFTTVVCMANTDPVIDTPQLLRTNQERGSRTGIRLLHTSAVTKGLKGKELVDLEQMHRAGAAGFTDDGIPLTDERLLKEAMERAKALGSVISLHEEDPLFVHAPGVNRGQISEQIGYPGAEAAAEEVMTARDVCLALATGARVCIQHISSGVSVELVRLAKRLGADVHAEATPHHFTLTEEAVLRYGTNARMNPPLRTEADRRAVIEGLKDGTIDMIVTDHAPHSPEEKMREMKAAPSGIIGLETSLGLGILSLVQPGHLSLMQLLEKMSCAPAAFYGLESWPFTPGGRADLVVFSPEEIWKVEKFASRSANSPFLGWELPGKIHYTICEGRIVYRSEE